jgi:hypothetical protein
MGHGVFCLFSVCSLCCDVFGGAGKPVSRNKPKDVFCGGRGTSRAMQRSQMLTTFEGFEVHTTLASRCKIDCGGILSGMSIKVNHRWS